MSISEMKLGQSAVATVVKNPTGASSELSDLGGRYIVEHWRDGERINEYHFDNGIVNEGKNFLLDVQFHALAAMATWYMGLIDNLNFSALDATDLYDDIDQAGNGWDEFALYTDAGNGDSATTRPEWDEGAASAQSITNSSVTVFDVTGAGTVKGLFLVAGTNANVKGDHTAGTAHKLWATALFSGDVAVLNGDQLKVTYTVSA
jgi:hypothetical protein